ncbi:MAG: hypothetical protein ACTSRP_08425 [Candidatus Helarchaeota archaeon]
MKEYIKKHKSFFIILIVIIAIASVMIPLLAWVGPDGLERVLEEFGLGDFEPIFAPFGISMEPEILADIINGVIGIVIVLGVALAIFYLMRHRKQLKQDE